MAIVKYGLSRDNINYLEYADWVAIQNAGISKEGVTFAIEEYDVSIEIVLSDDNIPEICMFIPGDLDRDDAVLLGVTFGKNIVNEDTGYAMNSVEATLDDAGNVELLGWVE
jgi:hypothetical protein